VKHLNLKLEKLEQRIAPTDLVMLGDADSGSYASPGGSVFSQVSAASLQSAPTAPSVQSAPSAPSAQSAPSEQSAPSAQSAPSEQSDPSANAS
jgi:hypothetical protein